VGSDQQACLHTRLYASVSCLCVCVCVCVSFFYSSRGFAAGEVIEEWFARARASGFRKYVSAPLPLAFSRAADSSAPPPLARNPLRLPVRETSEGRAICRLHNYGVCRKVALCVYDHEHCHYCLRPGHRALMCPVGLTEGAMAAAEQEREAQQTDTISRGREEPP
jgi:hypothetical protein